MVDNTSGLCSVGLRSPGVLSVNGWWRDIISLLTLMRCIAWADHLKCYLSKTSFACWSMVEAEDHELLSRDLAPNICDDSSFLYLGLLSEA